MKQCGQPDCAGLPVRQYCAPDLNRRISTTIFSYDKCSSCGVIKLANPPQDLASYYAGSYHELPSPERLQVLASRNRFKIETILRLRSAGRLLEVGPAYGLFAHQAKSAGFEVDVIEADERCCRYLREVVKVNVKQSINPPEAIRETGMHDVIALWHVIEHVPDPWALLKAAADNLAPGGFLVVAAPNPKAVQFSIMGSRWPHLDAPRHLWLLPTGTLTLRAAELGLVRVHCTTTDSDARYWNRFGWQRLLMNLSRNNWLRRLAYVAGYVISLAVAPFEVGGERGSAYTLIFRKVVL